MAFVGKRMHLHGLPSTSGFLSEDGWAKEKNVFSILRTKLNLMDFQQQKKRETSEWEIRKLPYYLWIEERNWFAAEYSSPLPLEMINWFVSNKH